MRCRVLILYAFSCVIVSFAQQNPPVVLESFDGVIVPSLPAGWYGNGFSTTISSSHSSPNCASATGNRSRKKLVSPIYDFSSRITNTLSFWERRTSSASGFRLEIRASLDGVNFELLLAQFDTISTSTSYVQRTVDLSNRVFHFNSHVQFQWTILPDSINNTGVLRIDDISISCVTGYDIGISNLTAAPEDITRIDPIHIHAWIKNFGSLPASAYSVRFFYDRNHNTLFESVEQFASFQGAVLAPRDSIACSAMHPPVRAGENCFAAVIEFPLDENQANDTAQITTPVGNTTSDMLVNEIMYSPAGDEPEWVELFNPTRDTVDLKNWRISDSKTLSKSWITREKKIVPPHSFFVVAKDSTFSEFHPQVPFVAADFSALNNFTSDAIVIYDVHTKVIDSVMYAPSWGGQNGKSLERIDLEWPSQRATNWGSSQNTAGSTPGSPNSIARLDYDIRIGVPTFLSIPAHGETIPVVSVVVYNIGRNNADSIQIQFFTDVNRDAIPDPQELIHTTYSERPLSPGDSLVFSVTLPELGSGGKTIIILAQWPRDNNLTNNRTVAALNLSYGFRDMVINEIMFDPLPGQTEWFELLNRSDQSIDLTGWSFLDKPGLMSMNSTTLTDQPFVVESGGYVIIAADSTLFRMYPSLSGHEFAGHICILNRSSGLSFNNDSDELKIKDITGQTIDSVAYTAAWHRPGIVDTRGRSLERINRNSDSNDPRNWSTCSNFNGGTPGCANSVMTAGRISNSMISLSPNPFSPDGDGVEDFCIIRYNIASVSATLNIKIYDIKGRLIRWLANGEQTGPQGEIIWDGYDESRQRARIGVYVIFLEATDRMSSLVVNAKAIVVVADK